MIACGNCRQRFAGWVDFDAHRCGRVVAGTPAAVMPARRPAWAARAEARSSYLARQRERRARAQAAPAFQLGRGFR